MWQRVQIGYDWWSGKLLINYCRILTFPRWRWTHCLGNNTFCSGPEWHMSSACKSIRFVVTIMYFATQKNLSGRMTSKKLSCPSYVHAVTRIPVMTPFSPSFILDVIMYDICGYFVWQVIILCFSSFCHKFYQSSLVGTEQTGSQQLTQLHSTVVASETVIGFNLSMSYGSVSN